MNQQKRSRQCSLKFCERCIKVSFIFFLLDFTFIALFWRSSSDQLNRHHSETTLHIYERCFWISLSFFLVELSSILVHKDFETRTILLFITTMHLKIMSYFLVAHRSNTLISIDAYGHDLPPLFSVVKCTTLCYMLTFLHCLQQRGGDNFWSHFEPCFKDILCAVAIFVLKSVDGFVKSPVGAFSGLVSASIYFYVISKIFFLSRNINKESSNDAVIKCSYFISVLALLTYIAAWYLRGWNYIGEETDNLMGSLATVISRVSDTSLPNVCLFLILFLLSLSSQWSLKASFFSEKARRYDEMVNSEKDLLEKQNQREQQEKQEARKANQEKSQFLRYLFHEVRVPLNSLVLGIEECRSYLCQDQDSDCSKCPASSSTLSSAISSVQKFPHEKMLCETLEEMTAAVTTMSRLLDDVLSLQKIEEGKLILEKKAFSLQDVIKTTSQMFKKGIDNKSLKLTLLLDSKIPELVGDCYRTSQVIANFLSNAIKFTPEKGNISIVLEQLPLNSTEQVERIKLEETSATPSLCSNPSGISPVHDLSEEVELLQKQSKQSQNSDELIPSSSQSLPAVACEVAEARAGTSPNLIGSDVGSLLKVKVSVIDSGIGISQEDQNNLFQPFVQIESGRNQKGKGTGLGLSICKKIIELYGGQIGVESEEGKGSTFYFILTLPSAPVLSNRKLPVASDSEASSTTSIPSLLNLPPSHSTQTQASPELLSSLRVLVVDDVDSNRRLLMRMVERQGFGYVAGAEDGLDALEKIRQAHAKGVDYQLVLLDHEMPKMNGLDCVRALRSEGFSCVVLGVTGNALEEDQQQFLEAGVNAVLIKPISTPKLMHAVTRHLKR